MKVIDKYVDGWIDRELTKNSEILKKRLKKQARLAYTRLRRRRNK